MQLKDMTGQRFGRLVVRERAPTAPGKYNTPWVCDCDCGGTKTVRGQHLRDEKIRSCGCLHRENVRTVNKTHGHKSHGHETRTYKSWYSMKRRCTYEGGNRWHRYGGRGITVCDRWQSFEKFLADMGERPEGRSIDRIDPDGNYEPGNCRWATPLEQQHNKSKI